jgi:hypothetical protein
MRSIVLFALLALLAILGRMTDDDTVFPYVKAGILAIAIRWGYAISNAVSAHFALKAKEELAQRIRLAEQERHHEALSQQFSEDKRASQKTAQAALSSLQSNKTGSR